MADALKNFFDRPLVERIADALSSAERSFPREQFVAEACRGLERLELMDRARHIMGAMWRALGEDYERAAAVLLRSLGPELDRTESFGMAPFFYLPHVLLVAEYGLEHFDLSMRLQYELTKRFSAEFSIRRFLDRYPEETLARLRTWARDPNVHVRRLVSEGTRPRLPWAERLVRFQRDPSPVIELLELLKDDSEQYVRRSVANNLNDIGKDHPELLVDVCARWLRGASATRRQLVRHALRTELKRGNPRALELLGFASTDGVQVSGSIRPRRIPIGGQASVSVTVRNEAASVRRVQLDLAVHFQKAAGRTSRKVFKLRSVELPPGASASVEKVLRFEQFTTRRQYPGRHRIEALVNGTPMHLGEVDVRLP